MGYNIIVYEYDSQNNKDVIAKNEQLTPSNGLSIMTHLEDYSGLYVTRTENAKQLIDAIEKGDDLPENIGIVEDTEIENAIGIAYTIGLIAAGVKQLNGKL